MLSRFAQGGRVGLRANGCIVDAEARGLTNLDWVAPSGKRTTKLAKLDSNGCFLDELQQPAPGSWTLHATWAGSARAAAATAKARATF